MPITVTVDASKPAAQLQAELDAADAALADNAGGVEMAVEIIYAAEVQRLNAGNFPPPLKPDTIKRKKAKGQPTTALVATGLMRDTIAKIIEGDHGWVRNMQRYGYIQQYGSSVDPARKWMYLDPEDEKKARAAFEIELYERPGIARLR